MGDSDIGKDRTRRRFNYAELHSYSAYTFGHGVCQPEELIRAAWRNGMSALAITDRDGLYAAPQIAQASAETGLPVVYGAQLRLGTYESISREGDYLTVLAAGKEGYKALCQAISNHNIAQGQRREAAHILPRLAQALAPHAFILTGGHNGPIMRPIYEALLRAQTTDAQAEAAANKIRALGELFGKDRVFVENCLLGCDGEKNQSAFAAYLSNETGIPYVITTGATCISKDQEKIADVLASRRNNLPLERMEHLLPAAHPTLATPTRIKQMERDFPHAASLSRDIAQQCAFELQSLKPRLPDAPVPKGRTQEQWLREKTYEGTLRRYGSRRHNPAAWEQIDKELDVIERLGFCGYFLIVYDIVQFCRRKSILCQGRGSAANSAVCYALEITAVDAVRHKMMFERFLSDGRSTPPDIDIDIESGRREEVIQYVYTAYGRHCAALVGTVISYKRRSALRDVAKALGYRPEEIDRHSEALPTLMTSIAEHLQELPQHMGMHPGGMVLTAQPVSTLCPIVWAAKEQRTVLQWDKDGCASAGLVKFDLLGLGMLSALHSAFDFLGKRGITAPDGQPLSLHTIPSEDPAVYRLLQQADTVGVFQVESRAQMNTLPRIKPTCFYDIVVEVALIRPGPIQGNAVNPYIERRRGRSPVTYVHPVLKGALEKTLGVPLFQEQLMKIAVDAAGCDPNQADALRKAMGAKRSQARMNSLKPQMMAGMKEKGLTMSQAEEIWSMLEGFAQFGFPESHAFSFAYIVYASAWLKAHYPAEFYAALLANQPMGFYSPQSLVSDARRHGITVHRADVNSSAASAQPSPDGQSLRLGLESIRGLAAKDAQRIVQQREGGGPYTSIDDLIQRSGLGKKAMTLLAQAGALQSLEPQRSRAIWNVGLAGSAPHQPTLDFRLADDTGVSYVPETPRMQVSADIKATGISPSSYPTVFIRERFPRAIPAGQLGERHRGKAVSVIGVITHRQRPASAGTVTFLSLEDETGMVNVICHEQVWKRYRHCAYYARAAVIEGIVQHRDGATALVACRMEEIQVDGAQKSRDFR